MILKKYNSKFITYQRIPGVYTVKVISEAVYKMGDHDATPQNEYHDISMKTTPILTRFGGTFGTLMFEE